MQDGVAVKKRLQGPRCKAKTTAGAPCQALAGADGKCSAHSGRQDMRELGRKGGKGRRGVKPESVPTSLREELRTLDPKIVRGAIEQALAGGNESARVSAVKLLADIDAFRKDADKVDRPREMAIAGAEARQHLANALTRATFNERRKWGDPVRILLEKVISELEDEAVRQHPDLRVAVGHVTPEGRELAFDGLEEVGLVVPRGKVEERAEQIAQERLEALKAEHSLTP